MGGINIQVYKRDNFMAEIIITSYFANGGIPTSGLSPTIRVWEVNATGQTLVITDAAMTEMVDGADSDGFYKYVFDTADGYNPKECYAFRVDGGVAQTDEERYQVGELNTTDNADALVDLIYDEPSIDHITTGSFGEMYNQISATTNTLLMDVRDVDALIQLAIKYSANKTKINHTDMTMTIYDSDCVTPLRTFQLLDKDGNPSITDMCERVPIASGTSDGQSTCG